MLDWERTALVQVYEVWAATDRSHRKLAHPGSRLGWVHVSESTVHRVLADEGLVVPPHPRVPGRDGHRQQFGHPYTPEDQAWIESLFGHIKSEWPHLEKIRNPGELASELDRARTEHNIVRLHASISYVTPQERHDSRGEGTRQGRRDGLAHARQARLDHRNQRQEQL